jgi:hypothetical protein
MNIYDTNIAIILREIQKSDSPDRALRHAYNDLVTTYESFCKKNACGIQGDQPSFQELFPAKRFFKEHKSIDIFDGLTEFELLTLRRVFQKRHIYQHDTQGIITEKYVRKVPEDGSLLGTKAALSMNEFNEAASHLRKIIDNMVSGAG